MQRAEQISRRLKLRHLNVLLAVIEQGSMVKAAERLAITQPVVSKTIADLENLLGVRLLDRGPQGIEPTLYGRALLKRSLSIFDDLKTSINELESLADPGAGELRIGCTEATARTLVSAIIGRLSRQHPRMTFEVLLADPASLLGRDLRGRRVDLIVGPFTADAGDDLDVKVLHRDRLHVVSGPSNPWADRRKVALGDLVNDRWVLPPPSHPIGAMVANAFRQGGLQPPRNVDRSVVSVHSQTDCRRRVPRCPGFRGAQRPVLSGENRARRASDEDMAYQRRHLEGSHARSSGRTLYRLRDGVR